MQNFLSLKLYLQNKPTIEIVNLFKNFWSRAKFLIKIQLIIYFGISFLFFLLILNSCSSTKKMTAKLGEIKKTDMEMIEFPADTNANALILSDIGEVSFTDNLEMVFERYRRVKILKEAGFHFGTVTIPYYAKDGSQHVKSIVGQTYNINADSSIQTVQLAKDSIITEDMEDGWRRLRFTLPAIKRGSIIEYSYKLYAKKFAWLRKWEFQTEEPTLYSEFKAEIPEFLNYIMIYQGTDSFDVYESETYSRQIKYFLRKNTTNFTINRWAMRDVPALRREPFITTLDDYRMMIRFQLANTV
ncbi:MAG: DUF3857 domain-containing protein, partial [Candidatus Hodarchaeota archaeon]